MSIQMQLRKKSISLSVYSNESTISHSWLLYRYYRDAINPVVTCNFGGQNFIARTKVILFELTCEFVPGNKFKCCEPKNENKRLRAKT